jgi:hypothetical protein
MFRSISGANMRDCTSIDQRKFTKLPWEKRSSPAKRAIFGSLCHDGFSERELKSQTISQRRRRKARAAAVKA